MKPNQKKEICTDNNLLWGGKAYSFGDFVCYLGWHASHVENTGSSFPENGFPALASRNVNLHNCLVIWKHEEHPLEQNTSRNCDLRKRLLFHGTFQTFLGKPSLLSPWKSSCGKQQFLSSHPTLSCVTKLSSFLSFTPHRKSHTFQLYALVGNMILTIFNVLKSSEDKINADPSIHTCRHYTG